MGDSSLHHHITEQAAKLGRPAWLQAVPKKPFDRLAFLGKPHLGLIFRKLACSVPTEEQAGCARASLLEEFPADNFVLWPEGRVCASLLPELCFLPSGRVQLGFSSRTAGCLVAGFQGRQTPYVTGGIFSSLFLCIFEQPLSSSERDFDILIEDTNVHAGCGELVSK